MIINLNKWFCRVGCNAYFRGMKHIAAIITLAVCASAASTQKRIVVADMDTRLPLPGAVVATDNGQRVVTDFLGGANTQLAFRSATVSKKHYMQRRVTYEEAHRDTLFLIPQEVVLHEVEVTAPGMSLDLRKSMRSVGENAKLSQMATQGFNLLGLFQLLVPTKGARLQSRADKIKKILDRY